MPPHVFTGEDLDAWIAAVNQFFEEHDSPEENKAQLAMGFLGQDVLDCIESFRVLLGEISGVDWVWTWPRLTTALHRMSVQIAYYRAELDQINTDRIKKGATVLGVGLLVGVAVPLVFLGMLEVAGFGTGGIAADSFAAKIQPSHVHSDSAFAFCQSAGACGAAATRVFENCEDVASDVMEEMYEASEEKREEILDQMPSYTWEHGIRFKPSSGLIITLLELAHE